MIQITRTHELDYGGKFCLGLIKDPLPYIAPSASAGASWAIRLPCAVLPHALV